MRIRYHGGKCCGVKTIEGFFLHPKCEMVPIKEEHISEPECGHNCDALSGGPHHTRDDFFNETAPQETAARRLWRFIDFLGRKRPNGIVEIVLNDLTQKDMWHDILLSCGFTVTAEFVNSNGGAPLTMYHMVMKLCPTKKYNGYSDFDENFDYVAAQNKQYAKSKKG